MGEARSRSQARREALQQGKPIPEYAPQVPRIRMFDAVAVDKQAIDTEYAEFLRANPGQQISLQTYLEALIEAALERERQAREHQRAEAEARTRLVQPATRVPPGMAEAAARLAALRRGA